MFVLRSMSLIPVRTQGEILLVMGEAIGASVDPPNIEAPVSDVFNQWGPENAAIASVVASTIFSVESKRRKSNHEGIAGRFDCRAPKSAENRGTDANRCSQVRHDTPSP